jgi:hypothetical protein
MKELYGCGALCNTLTTNDGRVFNVVKKWLEKHYYDFREDTTVLKTLCEWINVVEQRLGSNYAIQLKGIINEHHILPIYELRATSPVELIVPTMRRTGSGLQCHIVKKKKEYFNCVRGRQ